MKKYISIMAIMLCALMINVGTASNDNKNKSATKTECDCCKNCKDDKCKELCKKWCGMSAETRKTDEGRKVKEDCLKICKEKKCCTSASDKVACSGMEEKDCCKKK